MPVDKLLKAIEAASWIETNYENCVLFTKQAIKLIRQHEAARATTPVVRADAVGEEDRSHFDKATQPLLYALDQLDVYPQAMRGFPEGNYEQRTQFMEGWNAAVTAFCKHLKEIEPYLRATPAEPQTHSKTQMDKTGEP